MPERKLTPQDREDLRLADEELDNARPRRIVRHADNGDELIITKKDDLAAWKGITETHFYALKREGFMTKAEREAQKQAQAFEPTSRNGGWVPPDILDRMWQTQDELAALLRDENERLRDENAKLRDENERFRTRLAKLEANRPGRSNQ